MFRATSLRGLATAITTTALLTAGAAFAQDAGVTTDRYYDQEAGRWVMTREIETQNGGTRTVERVCGSGETYDSLQGCVRTRTTTGANGQTVTRQEAIVQGPVRTRAVGSITGPEGNSASGFRRWRN